MSRHHDQLDQIVALYPYGYDVITRTEVVPREPPPPEAPPFHLAWNIGLIRPKPVDFQPATPHVVPQIPTNQESEITLQLTADQQTHLSVSGVDRYGNPVNITGDSVWLSSDDSIIQVVSDPATPTEADAIAVGPAGTASVTFTNDVDRDGTGDFMGSLAIDVVAGQIAEIEVTAADPTDKPVTS